MSKNLIFIMALFALAVANLAPTDNEVVSNMLLSEDQRQLTFTAYGYDWSLSLQVAEHTEEGEGHFEGVVDGDHESIAHVNVYSEDSMDAVLVAGGELYFVEHDMSNDRYVMFKAADLPAGEDAMAFLPRPAEPLIVSDSEKAELGIEVGERAAAERPSAYIVKAFWDNNPPANLNRDQRAVVRGYFSALNTIVMRPAGLPLFSVQMVRGLRGRGAQTTRDGAHDWFTAYIDQNQGLVQGAHLVAWQVNVNFGGRAWLGTACNSRYPMKYKTGVSGTAVSGWWYDRAYTMRTLAHECGHTLGAPHQFGSRSIMDYYWPRGTEAQKVGFFNAVDVRNMRNAGC